MKLPIQFHSRLARESILGGAISLTLATLVVKVLGFLYKIPLAHILGSEGMSYFNGAYAVYSFFFVICSAGIPKAVSIAVTSARTKGDGKTERRILSLSTLIFGAMGIALALLLATLCKPLSALVGIDGAAGSLLCIAPSVVFVTLGGVLRGALTGRQRLVPVAMSQVIEATIKLVFGTFFAICSCWMGFTLEQICAATITGITLGAFVSYIYLLIALKKSSEALRGGEGMPLRDILRNLIRVILPVTAASVLLSLSGIVDLYLIINRLEAIGYTSQSANKIYGSYSTTVMPMLAFVGAIVSSIALASFPHMTKASVSMDHKTREEIFQNAKKIVLLFAIPAGCIFFFYGKELIFLAFPKEMVEVGGLCLRVIAPATVFLSLLTLNNTAMEAGGYAKAPLFTTLLTLMIKIPVTYLLMNNERFGILGAPIGTVVSYGGAMLLSGYLYRRKYGKYSSKTGISYSVILSSAVAFSSSELLSRVVFRDRLSVASSIVTIGLCGLIYLGTLCIFWTFDSRKKKILSE